MFQGEIQKRLDLLENNLVLTSDSQLHLQEKSEQGIADLTLHLQNPCILFKDLEHKKLEYFQNKKCADYVLYEQKAGNWMVHIFELKRTVGEKHWLNMKEQFKGAMQNALAIAGFLGIEVDMDNIYVYSAYRNDKLKDYSNPAKLRFQMHQPKCSGMSKECEDWNEKEVVLDFLDKEKFVHHKIPLDIEDGTGAYTMI